MITNNYIFVLSQNTNDWDIDMVTTCEAKAVYYATKHKMYITVFKDGIDYEVASPIYINANHYSRESEISACDILGLNLIKDELIEQQNIYIERLKLKEEEKIHKELETLAKLKAKYESK